MSMPTPYTIGITGGSGSGKTYFIKELSRHFKPMDICLVSQDHYYKPRDTQQVDEKGVKNFDLPDSIERDRLHEDIVKLKRGESVFRKEYAFNAPNVELQTLEFRSAPILIVEGLFVQYFPEIEKELDLKIFIEAKEYLMLSRRIRRDNEERGYDLDDVLYRYHHHVMPIYESLIEPLKHRADFVIPNNQHFENALDVLVRALKTHL